MERTERIGAVPDARSDWSQQLLHLIATRHPVRPADHDETYFRDGFGQTEKFVRRFAGRLDYRDKRSSISAAVSAAPPSPWHAGAHGA